MVSTSTSDSFVPKELMYFIFIFNIIIINNNIYIRQYTPLLNNHCCSLLICTYLIGNSWHLLTDCSDSLNRYEQLCVDFSFLLK